MNSSHSLTFFLPSPQELSMARSLLCWHRDCFSSHASNYLGDAVLERDSTLWEIPFSIWRTPEIRPTTGFWWAHWLQALPYRFRKFSKSCATRKSRSSDFKLNKLFCKSASLEDALIIIKTHLKPVIAIAKESPAAPGVLVLVTVQIDMPTSVESDTLRKDNSSYLPNLSLSRKKIRRVLESTLSSSRYSFFSYSTYKPKPWWCVIVESIRCWLSTWFSFKIFCLCFPLCDWDIFSP